MVDLTKRYDVLVIGGGNAALCAAMTAREMGKTVLLLEHAPRHFRGGNSRHTRNLRCMHDAPTDVLTDAYHEDEYWDDLIRVTQGMTNEALARMTIQTSAEVTRWMVERGVRFQPSLGGTLNLGRTNAFFLGGGKALVNAYFATAEKLGVDILYDSEVTDLKIDNGVFRSATVSSKGFPHTVVADNLVCASGGFQANLEWLEEGWGPPAKNFIIRGTPFNRGRILRVLLDNGVTSVGDPTQCHAVAIDARAPKFDGGIVTRLDCVPYSIVVDKNAQRFYDEGEDFWPKRYAIWGRLVARQPDQIAYSIIDEKSLKLFMPSVFPAIKANSIRELAALLELDPDALEKTVEAYNQAVVPGDFNNTDLDGCHTEGLVPPKTNWARKLDMPPFYAYPLRPGITFTYLGVKVDADARMLMADDQPCENMFATGEIMAGNILGQGYLAGLGMTIGTVFGRIAGREAAKNAVN